MQDKVTITEPKRITSWTLKVAAVFLVGTVSTGFAQSILVPPYLQPGDAPTLKSEQKVVIWQTDSLPGKFTVEFGEGATLQAVPKVQMAKVSSCVLKLKNKTTILYRASFTGLHFDAHYVYKIVNNGAPVYEGSFDSRTKGPHTRFIAFGDCGAGTPQQAELAYQMYQQKPQFALVVGDIVYTHGTEGEYRKKFFPYYNSATASPESGAPLMSTIPFYLVVGNHDTFSANFDKYPDGLAYFYYSDLPTNAPVPELNVKLEGAESAVKDFKKNTKGRFPQMTNFSFDYGNVHIVCLDANEYTNPLDNSILQWLTDDIKGSNADWKVVTFHQPGFNSSKAHYNDQIQRLLSPLLEELKVDLVLTGHVHNYQRTLPLKFLPKKDKDGTHFMISKEGKVEGDFTLDKEFDGVTVTKPKGIIYIVSGAGGAPLYDKALSGKPELWSREPQETWVPFTQKLISDVHSFTLIETSGKELVLKQIDAKGTILDEIKVTK